MSKRLNEFTRYLNEFGALAFDQLAGGRAAGMNGGAEGVSPDVSPLDGLAAHWSALSPQEKAKFLREAGTPRARARRKSRVSAAPKRARANSPVRPAVDDATSSRDVEKKRRKDEKKARKQAKKDAKAKAKLEKKLKKKLEKKARQQKKPNASGAKTAKKNAKANGTSASKSSGKTKPKAKSAQPATKRERAPAAAALAPE